VSGLAAYRVPDTAPQLGGAPIDTSDSRMLKAVYRNGFLYTARNTGYPTQSTTITYDVIDTSTMTLVSQDWPKGTIVFYPAFDVPATVPSGAPFATTSQISGTSITTNGTLTYAGISHNLKAGESPYFSTFCSATCPWGDYFGGTVDPVS